MQQLKIINLSDEIVQKVIDIRKLKKIKLPDAIILASAIISNLTLITRNTADFSNFEQSLKIVDPFANFK